MTDRDWLFPLPPPSPMSPDPDDSDMLLWSELWRSTGWPLDQTGLPPGYIRLPVEENPNKRTLDLSGAIRDWQPENWEIIIPAKEVSND